MTKPLIFDPRPWLARWKPEWQLDLDISIEEIIDQLEWTYLRQLNQ